MVKNLSLKPEVNGLFCEKIFGPINDFECSCGKKPTNLQKFCPNCGVEFTYSKKRRYQLGFIKLFNPAAHIWYLKRRPSYLSILLNFNRKQTESLIYCTESVLNSIYPNPFSFTFYPPSSTSFDRNYREVKTLQEASFVKSSRQSQTLYYPKILIKPFLYQLMNFNFSLIKSYLKICRLKKLHQPDRNFLKDVNINWDSFNNLEKKSFILSTLKAFLNSSSYWKLDKKKPIMLKKTH